MPVVQRWPREADTHIAGSSQCGLIIRRRFDGTVKTVYAIVLELPDSELLAGAGDQRRIGVWAVATLATDAGGWRSINRIGLPMIPPLFAQYNEDFGNRLNAGRPADGFATYGEAVTKRISAK